MGIISNETVTSGGSLESQLLSYAVTLYLYVWYVIRLSSVYVLPVVWVKVCQYSPSMVSHLSTRAMLKSPPGFSQVSTTALFPVLGTAVRFVMLNVSSSA